MNTTSKIVKVVTKALKSSPTGVSFFGVNNYTNANGEVSNFVINIGTNYDKAKIKDIEYLKNLDVKTLKSDIDITILEDARQQLLESLINPKESYSNGQKDAYTHINEAIKVHNETDAIYIFGTRVKKTVLVEGTYKTVNSRPLTIAKDLIRKNLKSAQFRLFKVEAQPENIVLSGANETILVQMV